MASGCVSSATSSTQASSRLWVVGAVVVCVTGLAISLGSLRGPQPYPTSPYTEPDLELAANWSLAAHPSLPRLRPDGQRSAPDRRRGRHARLAGARLGVP